MSRTEKRPVPGRISALAGLVLGGSASLAANVAHAVYVLPNVSIVTLGSALFWPSAALLGFEAVVRPPWPTQGWRSAPWWILRLGVVGVAIVAVVSSYEHMSGLLGHFHDNPFTVRYGPAAVDGLMVTCAAALLVIERAGATPDSRPGATPPRTLTARPAPGVAWAAPALALPAPMDSIGATLRGIEGMRTAAPVAAPAPPRATARVPAPPRAPRPAPASGDQGRPAPEWATRSKLGPGPHPGRPRGDLLADLRAALAPDDRIPGAEAIARHYRIKTEAGRALRDALKDHPAAPAAGGVEGDPSS